MGGIVQLGYLGFVVSDLARWEAYATGVLGLQLARRFPDGGFSLRHDAQAERVFIRPPSPGRRDEVDDLDVLGFEAEDDAAFDALAERLLAADADVEAAADADASARGVSRLLRFREPGGVRCELYVGPAQADSPFVSPVVRGGFVAGAQGFGHLALRAQEMQVSERFFCDVLGARLSDRIITRIGEQDISITFLHFNERHHSVALGEGLPKHLHHFMLQLNDLRDVGLALDRMVDHGVRIVQTLGQHPNDKMISFYSETPSGFEVELGWGGRTITAGWQPQTHGIWTEWGHRPPAMLARSGRSREAR